MIELLMKNYNSMLFIYFCILYLKEMLETSSGAFRK